MNFIVAITALLLSVGLSSSSAIVDLPSDKEWTSLSQSVDFMPAPTDGSPLLRIAQHRLLNSYKDLFVDGQETQYNEYAQSWRYLGLYTECDSSAQTCYRYLLWAAVSGFAKLLHCRDLSLKQNLSCLPLHSSTLIWTTKEMVSRST